LKTNQDVISLLVSASLLSYFTIAARQPAKLVLLYQHLLLTNHLIQLSVL